MPIFFSIPSGLPQEPIIYQFFRITIYNGVYGACVQPFLACFKGNYIIVSQTETRNSKVHLQNVEPLFNKSSEQISWQLRS